MLMRRPLVRLKFSPATHRIYGTIQGTEWVSNVKNFRETILYVKTILHLTNQRLRRIDPNINGYLSSIYHKFTHTLKVNIL